MHVVGTAGHVDHGKSALIAALTGTNPDRWIEEQVRGMTLDLGFAHLRFDDGLEAGVVDVPGHERFLHNMLAGASGMELLLLVVDANEGVMPQTLEHLHVLRFLDVRRILVVVSKIDLVRPELRPEAVAHVGDQLRDTVASGAPFFAVSAQTGEGLDDLKAALHDELARLPARDPGAPVYLPIDRAFTLPGLGTVVTGTLMQGSIERGASLAIEPGGQLAHVRSIGVFGSERKRVEAGSRVALSLPGVDRSKLARGQAVVAREFSARDEFVVRFTPLQDALGMLRRRTPVRAYVGSAEIIGTLHFDEVPGQAREVRARLSLREPVVAFPGVRFVLRRPSPKTLLGGGSIESVETLAGAAGADPSEATVLAVLRERGLDAVEGVAVAFAANLREEVAVAILDRLVERGDALRVARPAAYVDAAAAQDLLSRVVAHLEELQRNEPWVMGATSIALSRALDVGEALLVRIASSFVEEGRLAGRAGYYATLEHQPAFSRDQRALFDTIVPLDAEQPFLPAPFAQAKAAVKASSVPGAGRAFDTMLARGGFVKVGDDLYRGSQIGAIRSRLETRLRDGGRMTAAEFRDLTGTSRKYAVPLLEWFDARGVTIRDGNYRTLRNVPAKESTS